MKKIISILVFATVLGAVAFAQKDEKKGNREQWREKVRAEQVAFITSELDLTEAEAQKFWPVYNEVQASRREAYKESHKAMKALEEAVQKGEDTEKHMDKYIAIKKKIQELENDSVNKYSKVLPKEKVAKLILGEERFRHQQIGKLGKGHQGGPQGGKFQGGRPGNGQFPPRTQDLNED
ncbi:MAG: hypothetical protein K6E61_06430 [Bacteroidales bacterium]|nr:hypothetical protein [Bacteroidales bacterium]